MSDQSVCETCRFFDEVPHGLDVRGGHCKRRAPLVTGGMMSDVQTVWPYMGISDWCGEHEALDADPDAKLRDEFAGRALIGFLAGSPDADCGPSGYASDAYQQADAMIRARAVKS